MSVVVAVVCAAAGTASISADATRIAFTSRCAVIVSSHSFDAVPLQECRRASHKTPTTRVIETLDDRPHGSGRSELLSWVPVGDAGVQSSGFCMATLKVHR